MNKILEIIGFRGFLAIIFAGFIIVDAVQISAKNKQIASLTSQVNDLNDKKDTLEINLKQARQSYELNQLTCAGKIQDAVRIARLNHVEAPVGKCPSLKATQIQGLKK